jgi:hypothetical protein
MRLGARIIAEKNEKFCWTPEQVLCDKEKTAPKWNRSPNSCFNYENTTHYLSLFTRVRVGFARTSSASGTSAAGNRRYESSGSGTDESGCRSAAAARDKLGAGTASACDEPGAGAAATAARRTRRGRTTSSNRPTWSARRSDQSGGSWRNKSCCSRSGESFPSCCSHSGKACWFFSQQLVDRPVSQRRSCDVADSDHLNRSAHRCARAMHLVGWPVVPAGSETDRESFHRD